MATSGRNINSSSSKPEVCGFSNLLSALAPHSRQNSDSYMQVRLWNVSALHAASYFIVSSYFTALIKRLSDNLQRIFEEVGHIACF